MVAFSDMMRKQIVMPAHLMDDNEHGNKNGRNLFKDFSAVAQATGTYTGKVGAPSPSTKTVQCRAAELVHDRSIPLNGSKQTQASTFMLQIGISQMCMCKSGFVDQVHLIKKRITWERVRIAECWFAW